MESPPLTSAPVLCQRCICTSAMPGISMNAAGICSECVQDEQQQPYIDLPKFRTTLDGHLRRLRQQDLQYHVMVMLSGGKDSSYLLYLLKEQYHLRPLGFTVIHPFVNDLAKKNIERIAAALHVDVIKFYLDEMMLKRFIRYGTLHAQEYGLGPFFGCFLCSSVYHLLSLKMAIQMRIPYVLSGTSPHERKIPEFITSRKMAAICLQGATYQLLQRLFDAACGEEYRDSIYNFRFEQYRNDSFPYKIAPLSFLDYAYEHFMQVLADAGLLNTQETAALLTNCDVMHFFAYIAYKRYGCHPYTPHIAQGVRRGMPTLLDEFFTTGAGHLSRAEHIRILEEYKQALFYIAAHPKDRQALDRTLPQKLLPSLCARIGTEKVVPFIERLWTIHDYAAYFEIDVAAL